jgi:hypothetical protein
MQCAAEQATSPLTDNSRTWMTQLTDAMLPLTPGEAARQELIMFARNKQFDILSGEWTPRSPGSPEVHKLLHSPMQEISLLSRWSLSPRQLHFTFLAKMLK